MRLSELPLKRFYRYVIAPEPEFLVGGSELVQRSVSFAGLPQKQLFTLSPIVPYAWMVQSLK